jgi:hypothetical protein
LMKKKKKRRLENKWLFEMETPEIDNDGH